jgi:hypothetical protein
MKKLAVIILGVIMLNSCSSNEDANSIQISYDDAAGFIEHPSIITTQKAHSGNTCLQVSPDQVYGIVYKRKISALTSTKINKAKVHAWVRPEGNDAYLSLVCSIDKGAETAFWGSLQTKTLKLKNGEWSEINIDFDLGGFADPANVFNIYPMSDGKGVVMFDDLTINFE